MGSYAGAREEYHAGRGFFGAHLLQESDFTFKQLHFQLQGLWEWAHSLSGFEQDIFSKGMGGVGKKVPLLHYTMPVPIDGPIPGGRISLGLSVSSKGSGSGQAYSFREEASVRVACGAPKSEVELNNSYAYPLQNLMTFVCDRAQTLERFSVWREDSFSSQSNPEIRVIGARVQPEDVETAEPVHRFQMLFTLEDVEQSFADFIGKWLQLSDVYSAACSIFFGLQYGPPAYLDITFLAVAQALSLYHARREDGIALRAEEEHRFKEIVSKLPTHDAQWLRDRLGVRPYPPFQDILSELLKEHSDALNPLISGRQAGFVNEVMNTLHYVIRRDPEVSLAASSGADLYWMTEKLRFLVKACFLRELGFSSDKVCTLFERNALYQHIHQLEAERESARQRT